MGVRLPLTVGKAWGFPSNDVNSTFGFSMKRTGNSKVLGQERFTTRAGTFDTFKIETSFTERSTKDQTKKDQGGSDRRHCSEINLCIKQQPIRASASGTIFSWTRYNAPIPVRCG